MQNTLLDGLLTSYHLFPFSIQSKIRNFPTPVGMTFEKIEVNPDIPASRFAMPPKAEKPAEKPAATPPQV